MKAVIFGVTGQDGSYLADFLLAKGYTVIGVTRRTSTNVTIERLSHLYDHGEFTIKEGDVTDYLSVSSIIREYQPTEVYNLAAQSHVQTSFNEPFHTFQVNAFGTLHVLEAVRRESPNSKVYQASTSEMFGNSFTTVGSAEMKVLKRVQNEDTPFEPNSPYAISKLAAHHLVSSYRNGYNIFACAGILFNHESERRGENFVSRKITKYVAGLIDHINYEKDPNDYPRLRLGNLDSFRDWGYAPDYVEAMWMMLQQEKPIDFVIGTGTSITVRDFVRKSFQAVGIDDWERFVIIDSEFYRPQEVDFLQSDPSKADKYLGWKPTTDLDQMVKLMIRADSSTWDTIHI